MNPALLVSCGNTPAVVPEAFLLPGIHFSSVHVLTTEKPEISFIQEFFAARCPPVELTISKVAGFHDLQSEEDHFRFEEVLYRWVLATGVPPQGRCICLSGGFKTMSAAMQKAAAVLGAANVFHVLADNAWRDDHGRSRGPETVEEILTALDQHRLHWIQLGPESGWPQLRAARALDYPLVEERVDGSVRWISAPDQSFRDQLRKVVDRSHRIAGSWDVLERLPFVELATWPEADLNWLRQPLDPASAVDRRWVEALPKIELHSHLGGFATEGGALAEVRSAAGNSSGLPRVEPIELPENWPLPSAPVGLERYRRLGDNNGSRLLRDSGCLRRQCELLYQHLVEQHVLYAEIRCSPANYAAPDRSPWDVLVDIRDCFDECMRAHADQPARCHVNLILIGTRQSQGDYRPGISRHLALAMTAAEHWLNSQSCRVVGVDLAGYEDKSTRAHYFRDEFTGIHRCGLALTVHAGENDDAEGIWHAVFDLNARRLGHALSLGKSPELRRSIADRGIGVEMCPYANLQIRGFALDQAGDKPDYPLLDYLNSGIRVTINTDNIGISRASLTENLILCGRLCPELTRLDLLWTQRHAIDCAFLSSTSRSELMRQFSNAIPHP